MGRSRAISGFPFRPPARYSPIAAVVVCLAVAPSQARATDGIRTAGDVIQLLLPASAAGTTLACHDGRGSLQLAESAAAAMGATYTLKYAIDERRPNGGSHSFPSGHTSISFCSADFLRDRYGWKVGLPALVAATFVAYSRVESKEHYVHDVVAGAAIGVISSELLTDPYRRCRLSAAIGDDGRIWLRFRLSREVEEGTARADRPSPLDPTVTALSSSRLSASRR